jgi:hypothetical protein
MGKRLYKIAGSDGSDGINSCPTVLGIVDDGDNLVLQGYKLDGDTRRALNIPDGEDAIVMPKHVFLRGARRVTED